MKVSLDPRILVIKNSFDLDDTLFHGLMALGVLKEIAIKAKGINHKRWSAFMQRTGRFSELPTAFAPWSRDELLEFAALILAMSEPEHPLLGYVRRGIDRLDEISSPDITLPDITPPDITPRASAEYEHVINIGASINRPPYDVIRV